MILIGGATCLPGMAVVSQLLARGAKGRFAVLARDAAKAKPYADQGIEVPGTGEGLRGGIHRRAEPACRHPCR